MGTTTRPHTAHAKATTLSARQWFGLLAITAAGSLAIALLGTLLAAI